jgi:dihydroorotase
METRMSVASPNPTSSNPTSPAPMMPRADLLLRGGRVIDPANRHDGIADVAIQNGRVIAVGAAAQNIAARRQIDLRGAIVTPGFIDMHVHVYEWVTNFGAPADATGIQSGATTIVDQGSSGAWTFGGFKAFIADQARTDVRAFVSINVAGALQGGMEGTTLHNPGMVHVESLVRVAQEHPQIVRGIKCHWESGSLSHWGPTVLKKAAEAGRAAQLPLYVHTGELFPVDEANRPTPSAVMGQVVPYLKPGDTLAHIYSCMPDGIMSIGEDVPGWLFDAKAAGVLFDLGHGVNFSFKIARKMMEKGVLPDTIGSDVHGDFNAYHDLSILDYSLVGGMNKLIGLGMSLADVVRALTATPARVLADPSIGHLGAGARANVTVLRPVEGEWTFLDARRERLTVRERLLPDLVVIDGEVITPDCGLLADVMAPTERPRGITRPSYLAGNVANIAAQ